MPHGNIEWVKLSTNIFDDEKIKLIRSMPNGDSMVLIWIQLIVQAGKVNDGGIIRLSEGIPYSDEMLATVLNHPISTVRLAIDTFIRLGMLNRTDEGLWLANWEKHQNVDGMERIREQNRLRQQRRRAKLRAGIEVLALPQPVSRDMSRDVTHQSKSKNKNIDIKRKSRERESVTPSLLQELTKLPQWGASNDNHDTEWLVEFLSEFPNTTPAAIRACRDYHSHRRKHNKGLWKLRLRHWMEKENEYNNNGHEHQTRRCYHNIPESYEAPPKYDD